MRTVLFPLLAASLLSTSALLAECNRAPSQYSQPSRRMDEALQQLAHQTGCAVQVDLGPLASVRVTALHGRYTPLQALARLARGTGYVARGTPDGLALASRFQQK